MSSELTGALSTQAYVDAALANNDDAEGAAIYLAVWLANEAADSSTNRAPIALVKAYRRVRAMADEEADGSGVPSLSTKETEK